MDNVLRLVLYLSTSFSLFMFMSLTTIFNEELSFKNLFLCITPVLICFLIHRLYLKEKTKAKSYKYQDGDVLNIFADMPWSVNGEEYSEGVFFWYKGGNLFTDFEFHLEKGGDPEVFLEWLEQEKRNPRYLMSVSSKL